jgi:hypothetical protein
MIKEIAKDFIGNCSTYYYHLENKNFAKRVLRSIESVKGKTDSKLIKLSNDYARDILGWIGYSPWLYVYSAIAESFKEGWIPDNYYGKIVVPSVQGDYGKISYLKSLTHKIFSSNVFPDLAYYVNGLWVSIDNKILSENSIKENLFKKSKVVVFKIDNSIQGKGVYFFEEKNFEPRMIHLLGNGVVQYYINQHNYFDEFTPNSVATLRCTTVIDDNGNPSLRACYLRIGRNADAHVKSVSHIRVPVNLKTGELDELGYMTNWVAIDKHPDTGTIFSKKQIPFFTKCVSVVLELHKLMPFSRSIGWDVIVDEQNEIKIMEWNGEHNDIKFSEATQGPCFSDLGWENLWRNK